MLVASEVKKFKDAKDRQIFAQKKYISQVEAKLATHSDTIAEQQSELHELGARIKQQSEWFEALRDPNGLTSFRHLCEEMDQSISQITTQKSIQLKALDNSLRMMQTCEKDMVRQ